MTSERVGIEKHLELQLYELRRKFEYSSPILTIQKTAKMFLKRKIYLKKQRLIRLLTWTLNRWYMRSIMLKMLSGLGLNKSLLYMIGKIRFIQKHYRIFKLRKEVSKRIAIRGQTIFRMKQV